MTDLDKALGDILSIRKQVASTTEFRGYGPATLAFTAVLAVLAAAVQELWVANPAAHIVRYVTVWACTAAVCAALTGWQMYTRSRRMHSRLSNEMLRMAAEQFVPPIAAGALLTFVLVRYVPQAAWMLPGLWQISFSLGVFASCRSLPKPMAVAGVWYMLTGLSCVAMAGPRALSPWNMGVSFGIGQGLVAAVLQLGVAKAGDDS